MATIETLTQRANHLLGDGGVNFINETITASPQEAVETRSRPFSIFNIEDLGRAMALASEMANKAEQSEDPETGIEQALELAEQMTVQGEAEMAAHALRLFNTHTPTGRLLRLARPIEISAATLVPKQRIALEAITAAPIDLWREDPLANEHHFHWHVVYPVIGLIRENIPQDVIIRFNQVNGDLNQLSDDDLNAILRYQDRHGEMFVYMHQQMLARYDAERVSVGLEPVAAIDQELQGSPVAQPYDVDPVLEADGFTDRDVDQVIPSSSAALVLGWKHELEKAIDDGEFLPSPDAGPLTNIPINADNLGSNIEAAFRIFRSGVDLTRYGNLHNTGHGILASLSPNAAGVMNNPMHAIRDPIFWRWHKLIDDLSFRWQQTQDPLDFSDRPSQVTLGKGGDAWSSPDLFFVSKSVITDDVEASRAALADRLLAKWDANEIDDDQIDTLTTRLLTAYVALPDSTTRTIQYLSHDGYVIAVRLENNSAEQADVTLRIFIAASARADDRRAWIEMDKVTTTLEPNERKVVVRLDEDSEVVKKPIDIGPDNYIPARDTNDARCSCGWPYPLMLPRGTTDAQEYKMIVVLTDSSIDGFANQGQCGSVSFCGARDTNYPDLREMGYPFNRPWVHSISETAQSEASIAGSTFSIQHNL